MTNIDISPLPADTKDWTVVLRQGCTQCGFQPGYDYSLTGERLRSLIPALERIFEKTDPALRTRPNETTWAPLEYLAHISEVCGVMVERLHLMLEQSAPQFPSWDQDAAAIEGAYQRLSVERVREELLANVVSSASEFEVVDRSALERRGVRGDGGEFTVRTLAEYFVHDMEHHVFFDLASDR